MGKTNKQMGLILSVQKIFLQTPKRLKIGYSKKKKRGQALVINIKS